MLPSVLLDNSLELRDFVVCDGNHRSGGAEKTYATVNEFGGDASATVVVLHKQGADFLLFLSVLEDDNPDRAIPDIVADNFAGPISEARQILLIVVAKVIRVVVANPVGQVVEFVSSLGEVRLTESLREIENSGWRFQLQRVDTEHLLLGRVEVVEDVENVRLCAVGHNECCVLLFRHVLEGVIPCDTIYDKAVMGIVGKRDDVSYLDLPDKPIADSDFECLGACQQEVVIPALDAP